MSKLEAGHIVFIVIVLGLTITAVAEAYFKSVDCPAVVSLAMRNP